MGLCQYYRRFVPNFSSNAAPLHALTKKGGKFQWTPECEEAFQNLETLLVGSEVLPLPNDKDTFILDCDASELGIAAILSQAQEGVERPICYAGHLYNKHEKNYNITRKELLATTTLIKKLR